MRLTERVHLVGSGRTGFNISDPYDCHVYLVDGGSELARIGTILLTHAHADHAGWAAGLRVAAFDRLAVPPGMI